MLPLFESYPELAEKLPHIDLGLFPTPVFHLKRLGNHLSVDELYFKQDGESGAVYGGNKIRKLEFILADALKKKAKTVLTFGYAGSNHALATSIYAGQVGLGSISVLLKQPNAFYVRRNLLMGLAHGAKIGHYPNEIAATLPVLFALFKKKYQDGKFPYIIPPGGSSPLGVVGYVNAAYELKQQVEEGLIPEPDLVFVPMGTMGTAVGLVLGLKACGMKTKVISVRVTDEKFGNIKKFIALFEKTRLLIASASSSFPTFRIDEKDIHISHDFFGEQYARFTPRGAAAIDLVQTMENFRLEGTYTGKTMAALMDYVTHQDQKERVILFWNTYNARDFPDAITSFDYRRLPSGCHRYFENEVQPLDNR